MCSVVRAEPPSCGSCVVCLWKKAGRRQGVLTSPLHLRGPQSSRVSTRLSLNAGAITSYGSKEQVSPKSLLEPSSSYLLGVPASWWFWSLDVTGVWLVSNFWVSLLIKCHAVFPLYSQVETPPPPSLDAFMNNLRPPRRHFTFYELLNERSDTPKTYVRASLATGTPGLLMSE